MKEVSNFCTTKSPTQTQRHRNQFPVILRCRNSRKRYAACYCPIWNHSEYVLLGIPLYSSQSVDYFSLKLLPLSLLKILLWLYCNNPVTVTKTFLKIITWRNPEHTTARDQAMGWYNFEFMSAMTSFSIPVPAARKLKKVQAAVKKCSVQTPDKTVSEHIPLTQRRDSHPSFCHFVNASSSDNITVGTLMFLLGLVLRLSSSLSACPESVPARWWETFPYSLVLLFCPSVQLACH